MLPGLNGYEVLRRLREQDIWTPVLMLTAKDGEYDQADQCPVQQLRVGPGQLQPRGDRRQGAVRSSWEASPTNRCCARWPASSLVSLAFMVSASWAISSRESGTGTRSDRSDQVRTPHRAGWRSKPVDLITPLSSLPPRRPHPAASQRGGPGRQACRVAPRCDHGQFPHQAGPRRPLPAGG